MTLQTKYFGAIEISEAELIRFPVGMLGFEEEHSFVLLPFASSDENMLCLQSTETPGLAFVVLNPFHLQWDYTPVLSKSDLKDFGVQESGELAYYVMCSVKNPVSSSTVNMKCPIAVHPDTREARQIIMDTDAYQMRESLVSLRSKEATGAC